MNRIKQATKSYIQQVHTRRISLACQIGVAVLAGMAGRYAYKWRWQAVALGTGMLLGSEAIAYRFRRQLPTKQSIDLLLSELPEELKKTISNGEWDTELVVEQLQSTLLEQLRKQSEANRAKTTTPSDPVMLDELEEVCTRYAINQSIIDLAKFPHAYLHAIFSRLDNREGNFRQQLVAYYQVIIEMEKLFSGLETTPEVRKGLETLRTAEHVVISEIARITGEKIPQLDQLDNPESKIKMYASLLTSLRHFNLDVQSDLKAIYAKLLDAKNILLNWQKKNESLFSQTYQKQAGQRDDLLLSLVRDQWDVDEGVKGDGLCLLRSIVRLRGSSDSDESSKVAELATHFADHYQAKLDALKPYTKTTSELKTFIQNVDEDDKKMIVDDVRRQSGNQTLINKLTATEDLEEKLQVCIEREPVRFYAALLEHTTLVLPGDREEIDRAITELSSIYYDFAGCPVCPPAVANVQKEIASSLNPKGFADYVKACNAVIQGWQAVANGEGAMWGGYFELLRLAEILQRPIHLFDRGTISFDENGDLLPSNVFNIQGSQQEVEPLCLVRAHSHYQGLRPKRSNT